MNTSFSFSGIPKFEFGTGKINLLPHIIPSYGKNLLLLTGNSSFRKSRKFEDLIRALINKDINIHTAVISQEPSPEIIDSIIDNNRIYNINIVVAVGGGSVIDAGKAVAAIFTETGSAKDFLEGVGSKTPSGSTLPFIAIPTTSGTGSEATKNAVLSEVGNNGFKKSLRHDNFIPKMIILDPELTLTCPTNVTAASGLDALSQLIESYVSTKATPLTDALAYDGITKALNALIPISTDEKENIELRADMSYAAFLSGITLAHAGLGTAHGMASEIGGLVKAPHGVICGKLLAPWIEITIKELQKDNSSAASHYLDKFEKIGKLLVPGENNRTQILDNLVKTLYSWEKQLNIPPLSKYGLTENMISIIAKASGNKNNPVKLSDNMKASILKTAK